jgi:hypothetical protein
MGIAAKEAARFTSLLVKWHDNSGPEWTANRIKSLEAFAKEKYLRGGVLPIPLGWATTSSRRHKIRFCDDLLHHYFSSNEFEYTKAMNFCRLASSLSLFKERGKGSIEMLPPSKQQLTKMLTAIEGPVDRPANIHWERLGKHIKIDVDTFPTYRDVDYTPLVYKPIADISSPVSGLTTGTKTSKPIRDRKCFSINVIYTDSRLQSLLGKHGEFLSATIFGKDSYQLPIPDKADSQTECLAGTISPIQELGCKLRPAANPWLALQAINEPLKRVLEEVTKVIPQIVTYDQEIGRSTLYEWIKNQTKVWSLDASSFTDRFPIEFQLAILKKLQKHKIISEAMYDVFEKTSQMSYWFEPIQRPVTYKFGQPQGLGPSFSLATLAHFYLLDSLSRMLKVGGRPFRVLGDDVIISNERLAFAYMQWMQDCNVEINLSKSIVSRYLGEFAGSLITPKGIFNRPKLSILKSNDSFISWVDLLVQQETPMKFIDFMFQEHHELTLKMSVPDDFGGRRFQVYSNWKPYLQDLDNVILSKQRILKEIREFLPYLSSDVVSFLEGKEYIKSGIFYGLPYNIEDLTFIYGPKEFRAKESVSNSAIRQSQIRDLKIRLKSLKKDLHLSKTVKALESLFYKYQDVLTRHGHLNFSFTYTEKLGDFEHQMSKMVHSQPIEDPSMEKRKSKRNPKNTGWKNLLGSSK